ncbi:MAG: biotin-dependent carboxyltransferase family protein [Pseudomonadota bacterium]
MTLQVLDAGLQTSIQGAPRRGQRHWAVPSGGAADALSLALANRLVGNRVTAAGLEISVSGASFECVEPLAVAVTGADAALAVNGHEAELHTTIRLQAGDRLEVGAARSGARSYLAVAGDLDIPCVLGSPSTCMAARFGGLEGRALEAGDRVGVRVRDTVQECQTPSALRYAPSAAAVLRAVPAAGFDSDALFDVKLTVGSRADRMGVQLSALRTGGQSDLPSNPVFPGGIQLPPDGQPFVLGVDAQTTGGYALLANVARVDRHALGQLRPGSSLTFARRDPAQAREEWLQKVAVFRAWLEGAEAAVR